jgi:hypothetical protein
MLEYRELVTCTNLRHMLPLWATPNRYLISGCKPWYSTLRHLQQLSITVWGLWIHVEVADLA